MKHALILIGAAAFACGSPALAKPGGGNGHGNGHGHGYSNEDRGRWADGDRDDGHGRGSAFGYGRGGCPPGLARKHNGCMPPGQARKLARGSRWVNSYGTRYGYGRIPESIRDQYDLTNRYRYYYNNGALYQVDPRTMLVQQVINALIR